VNAGLAVLANLAGLGGPALQPGTLFNPLLDRPPLAPGEILAGPYGLLFFLPLIPPLLLVARHFPRAALVLVGFAWAVLTLRLETTLVLLGWLTIATAWVLLLASLRRREWLSRRAMIGLIWVGVHALVLPLWWNAQQSWYPSRMAALHNVGFSYFLLRLVAWGVDLANTPQSSPRLADTICWLLYPPCMRLGPILRQQEFSSRLVAWRPPSLALWREGAKRIGLFLLGGVGLALVGRHIPDVDFFATPEEYHTSVLIKAFYLVPIQIYLLLWTYNELAVAASCWVGIRVDDNFRRLPLATSVRDFWHRWHVTVGAWLRDYIYVPLGGNRRHVSLNIIAVFAYCGLWHGASWSFLAWGLSQAAALIVQRGWDHLRARLGWEGRPGGRLWTVLCWLLTMHYQVATIVIFADFDHLGGRLLRELVRRLAN